MSLGAANPKRQMMINMMYLVLTALLALNVSAEILKAFALVNGSLQETNKNFLKKNNDVYDFLKDQADANPKRAKHWLDQALKGKAQADLYFNYLQNIKEMLAAHAGGWKDEDHTTVDHDGELEVGTHWFINLKHGEKLRDSINDFVTAMNALVEPDTIVDKVTKKKTTAKTLSLAINTEIPASAQKNATEKIDWSTYFFHMVPIVADITQLNQYQNKIRNTEYEFAQFCAGHIGKTTIKIDKLIPIISAERAVIPQGEKYNASIYLGAVDESQSPKISVNGRPLDAAGGKADFETVASGSGEQKLNVEIIVKDPDGNDKKYTTTTSYSVFTAAADISAEKMNVVYMGLDNPISVTVPGYQPSDISATTDGEGGVTWTPNKDEGAGHYILRPPVGGKQKLITVTAMAKSQGGGARKMGTRIYKVKAVPRPVPQLAGIKEASASRGELKLVKVVIADMQDFIFEGLTPTVLEGNVALAHKSTADGPMKSMEFKGKTLTSEIISMLGNAKSGDQISLYNVKIKAIDGSIKTLNSPVILVK